MDGEMDDELREAQARQAQELEDSGKAASGQKKKKKDK